MELSLNPEIFLLGGIFQDERAIFKVYSELSAKDFSTQKYGYVFSAMQELAAENAPIDVLSVFDRMQKTSTAWLDKDDLFSILESVPSAANIEYYASLIKESSVKRSLRSLFSKAIGMTNDETIKSEEIISFMYDEVNSFDKKKNEPKIMAECIKELYEIIGQGNHIGLPTGLTALDNMIVGMRPGELIVLAAPPSVGKTALAISLISNIIKSGKTVALFSIEMTKPEITLRFVSMNSRVDSFSIWNSSLKYGENDKVLAGVKTLERTKCFIDDSSSIKVPEIRMKCSAIKCKTGSLDLVVVDYLQLIESGKKENQTIAMGDVSRNLKILAKELEVPVLCLSQLNRGYKEGKISLFNLRDSGNIEQDANQVWFVYFPKDKHDPKLAQLEIAKNRNGKKGTIDLQFEAEYTLFTDYDYSRMNPKMRNGGADKDGFFPVDIPTEAR